MTVDTRQEENATRLRELYSNVRFGRCWLAERSSLCPLCMKFISRNHSWSVKLSQPVPLFIPDPYSRERGFGRKQRPGAGRGTYGVDETRQYAHAECAAKYCKPYDRMRSA